LRFRVYITYWTLAFALAEHVGAHYTLLPWQLPTNDIVFKNVEIFTQKIHISICVFYKHGILALCLSDFMNLSIELRIYYIVEQFFEF
jgi:hypothetical protein